jgi:hypothetical protein
MYSAAFFEKDPRKVVEAGLSCLPAKSPYAMTIADVLKWSGEQKDWKAVWKLIEQKWNKREPCPDGALKPFNIDAKLNGAYIVLGLLYGDSDFWKTMEISTRAGQDSDCNPSNACGILGTMIGYKRIPDEWKSGIPKIANEKFRYTDFTFNTIVDSTQKRAIDLVKKNGGSLNGETLTVRTQAYKPTKLELWDDYGSPVERVSVNDSRWSWSGDWRPDKDHKLASAKGAEASFKFQGTGVIVVGKYLPKGGKADVYLDGKLAKTVDVYPDENATKGCESVWHAFRLKNAEHTVKIVLRGEPGPGSQGTDVSLQDFVVFR